MRVSRTFGAIAVLFWNPIAHSITIDEWVTANTADSTVLCKRQLNDEFFFLSRKGNQITVGTRLDMTEYQTAHKLAVAWKITDQDGKSLIEKVPPVALRNAYVRMSGKTFAEDVKNETLNTLTKSPLRANVEVEKCLGDSCSSEAKGDSRYTVTVCPMP